MLLPASRGGTLGEACAGPATEEKKGDELFHTCGKGGESEKRSLEFDIKAAVGDAQRIAATKLVKRKGKAAGGDARHSVKFDQFHLASFDIITRVIADTISSSVCCELVMVWRKNSVGASRRNKCKNLVTL